MHKTYQMNYDGTNTAAVHALTKKDALKKLGVSAYMFNGYGHSDYNLELPTFGEVYYRPITSRQSDEYPWRKERYRLKHDKDGRAYYE